MSQSISPEFQKYLDRDAERHRESAARALRELIADAQDALERIEADEPTVRSSVGGSILNSQRFDDAERNLVRFWDAANVAALVRSETER